ncbi:MAG: ATP-binding cassette domain-containing protein, partial [Acidobacteriota bacterium]
MIHIDQLHKRFDDVVAVDDVSLAARDGEVTGLLGPNGAGKTTTLRMLYGLLQPTRGRAVVDGLDSADDADRVRARLGVLTDSPGLYPRLTPREHLAYSAALAGVPRRQIDAAVAEAADAAGLDGALLDRPTAAPATRTCLLATGSACGSTSTATTRRRWNSRSITVA